MTGKTFASCIAIAAVVGVAGLGAQAPSGQAQERAGSQQHSMKGMSEAEFVPMMVKHHQDGIAMAQHEEQNGSSAEVKALAAKIRQSQERDLPELKQHAQHVAGSAKGTSGHDAHDKQMEQQSQAVMKRLKSASGQALDHAFLEEMAKHHQQAIDMAQGAKLTTPAIKTMAQKMVAGQRQELGEIKKLLAAHGASK